ncbi:hypothetical protein HY642_00455 [Candidatus Woesearchaeota archaeon]|nr:hypothetical protein [Candidatus Woesearchaeota archaeon]
MMEDVAFGIGAALLAWIGFRLFFRPKPNPYADEVHTILNSDEHKVKGRYD